MTDRLRVLIGPMANSMEIGSFDALSRSNPNSAWGAFTMEMLARLGLETVVISPGSRSTPLTFAAARNRKLESIPVLDERSAAFFALGIAKRTSKPVALVCTSGSALANYYPAVVEASMSGTPLLILTADRPPELRDCSSGQTIDQVKFFGNYVRHFAELSLPQTNAGMFSYLRQTLVHAVDRSLNSNPGPIHLNFPFRDPLIPEKGKEISTSAETLESAATVITRPCESVSTNLTADTVALERLGSHRRGLIVVGDVNTGDEGEPFAAAVAVLSEKLGWPVFSDVLNPLRSHAGENRSWICHYDAFLRGSEKTIKMRPTAVLQIGPLPTSKRLQAWLKEINASNFLLTDRPVNIDSQHRVSTVLHGDVRLLSEQVSSQKIESKWVEGWKRLEEAMSEKLDANLNEMDTMFEGKAAWLLSQYAPPRSSVFLAGSMSVRYAEWFWRASGRAYSIFANRGVNGIDGTLGSALGVAHGGRPALLLTGDLAFLHDSNALLASKELRGGLTVVLIHNNGGGIFEHLPVAGLENFENYFATPQEVDFKLLCESHGVPFQRILDWDMFVDEISRQAEGVRVLEIRTDRKSDRKTLRKIWKRL